MNSVVARLVTSSKYPPSSGLFGVNGGGTTILPIPIYTATVGSLPSDVAKVTYSYVKMRSSGHVTSDTSDALSFGYGSRGFVICFVYSRE